MGLYGMQSRVTGARVLQGFGFRFIAIVSLDAALKRQKKEVRTGGMYEHDEPGWEGWIPTYVSR